MNISILIIVLTALLSGLIAYDNSMSVVHKSNVGIFADKPIEPPTEDILVREPERRIVGKSFTISKQ